MSVSFETHGHEDKFWNLGPMPIVHIQGRTNPADFLTRKRFPDGPGPAPHTGYAEPDLALELFTASGAASAFVAAGPSAEPTSQPRFARRSPLIRSWGPLRRKRRRRPPARGGPRHPFRGGASLAARLRLAGRAPLPPQPARRPPLRARRASDPGAARAACNSAGRALWPRQDVDPGSPLGVVARPAGGCGGVRAHLPDVSARQGRPPAAGRSAVPPAGPHASRRVHQPGLPRAARRPLRPRLPAGAH